jgi:hypothetical protein
MHDEGASKSEVARLRQQIELEFASMQRGLTAFALGTARHTFIYTRMEHVEGYQRKLAELVGESKAAQVVCERYNAVMEENEQTTGTLAEDIAPEKMLWILEYTEDDSNWYKLVPFYAISEQDAEQQVQEWIEQIPYRVFRKGLRAHPQGFRMHRRTLPGKI